MKRRFKYQVKLNGQIVNEGKQQGFKVQKTHLKALEGCVMVT